jgi:hypothetical protein
MRYIEGQATVFTTIQSSIGIVVYDPSGYAIDLIPNRFLSEGESVSGILRQNGSGLSDCLVYKIRLQNQPSAEIVSDMTVMGV